MGILDETPRDFISNQIALVLKKTLEKWKTASDFIQLIDHETMKTLRRILYATRSGHKGVLYSLMSRYSVLTEVLEVGRRLAALHLNSVRDIARMVVDANNDDDGDDDLVDDDVEFIEGNDENPVGGFQRYYVDGDSGNELSNNEDEHILGLRYDDHDPLPTLTLHSHHVTLDAEQMACFINSGVLHRAS